MDDRRHDGIRRSDLDRALALGSQWIRRHRGAWPRFQGPPPRLLLNRQRPERHLGVRSSLSGLRSEEPDKVAGRREWSGPQERVSEQIAVPAETDEFEVVTPVLPEAHLHADELVL